MSLPRPSAMGETAPQPVEPAAAVTAPPPAAGEAPLAEAPAAGGASTDVDAQGMQPQDNQLETASVERRRTARLRNRRMWTTFLEDVGFVTVGSPEKVLRMHTVFTLTAVCFAVGYSFQIFIVILYASINIDGRGVWYRVVPELLLDVTSCVVCVTQARCMALATTPCLRIVWTFNHGMRVADQLVAHARDDFGLRNAERCAGFLVLWCLIGLMYEALLPPCDKYSSLSFWNYSWDALPCESWEMINSVVAFSNCIIGISVAMLPRVIDSIRPCYCPLGRKGLPPDMMELLPCFEWGSKDSPVIDPDDETMCSICIEDYSANEMCRRLPCGHFFHKPCLDSWLATKPTCPLRCHNDLWQAVREEAKQRGIALPRFSTCFEVPDGVAVVGRPTGVQPRDTE